MNFRGCAPGDCNARGGEVWSRIRDSKPSDTGSRGHSDPVDVGAVNSLSSGKRKGSSSPRDGSAVEHFTTSNACKSTGKQSSGMGKQSKSWSKSEATGKSKENEGSLRVPAAPKSPGPSLHKHHQNSMRRHQKWGGRGTKKERNFGQSERGRSGRGRLHLAKPDLAILIWPHLAKRHLAKTTFCQTRPFGQFFLGGVVGCSLWGC